MVSKDDFSFDKAINGIDFSDMQKAGRQSVAIGRSSKNNSISGAL